MENNSEPSYRHNKTSDQEPLQSSPSRTESAHGRNKHADKNTCCNCAACRYEKKHPFEWVLECGVFILLCGTLIATGGAAYYTKQQWMTAYDTEKRSLRAYAFATPTGIKDFSSRNHASGGVTIRTMGQTPAYKVRSEIGISQKPYPLPADEDLRVNIRPDQIRYSAFISPTNFVILAATTDEILDQPTVDAISDGKKLRLFVWGRVDYEDVFLKPHWFTFCTCYDGNRIKENSTGGEVCPRYNEADSDPPQSPDK